MSIRDFGYKASLHTVSLLIAFLLISPSNVFCDSANQPFVDLDGDGLNDNIQDIDNNSIPDAFQSKLSVPTESSLNSFSGFSSGLNSNTKTELNLTLSQSFSLNKFSVRYIDKCRSDFDAGFGVRVGFGGSSGGGCAGGVCF